MPRLLRTKASREILFLIAGLCRSVLSMISENASTYAVSICAERFRPNNVNNVNNRTRAGKRRWVVFVISHRKPFHHPINLLRFTGQTEQCQEFPTMKRSPPKRLNYFRFSTKNDAPQCLVKDESGKVLEMHKLCENVNIELFPVAEIFAQNALVKEIAVHKQ